MKQLNFVIYILFCLSIWTWASIEIGSESVESKIIKVGMENSSNADRCINDYLMYRITGDTIKANAAADSAEVYLNSARACRETITLILKKK